MVDGRWFVCERCWIEICPFAEGSMTTNRQRSSCAVGSRRRRLTQRRRKTCLASRAFAPIVSQLPISDVFFSSVFASLAAAAVVNAFAFAFLVKSNLKMTYWGLGYNVEPYRGRVEWRNQWRYSFPHYLVAVSSHIYCRERGDAVLHISS